MTTEPLPPYSAIGNCHIFITGTDPLAAKWDAAKWDQSKWADIGWVDVTPHSMMVEISWGTDDPQGVLTVPAAGVWTIKTYDPQRMLDPSNGSSPHASYIRPGQPIRIAHVDGSITTIICEGFIDEVQFELMEYTGTLTGTGGIQLLATANMTAGQELDPLMPTTLRARAAYLIDKVGMSGLISVESDPYDPPVGKMEEGEFPVWTHILTSAFDALYAVWLDRLGVLRFRSFGAPIDRGFQVGGEGGIPISTINVQTSLTSVFTKIIAFDEADPLVPIEALDIQKSDAFGLITLKRDRPIPAAQTWVDSILADRSGAALQYIPGTLYPQTPQHLLDYLELGVVEICHFAVETLNPPITIPARVLGGKIIADTGTGWTLELITYIPAKEWSEVEVPPVIPPPVGETEVIVATYTCTKDVRAARTDTGANYGAGAEGENPVGAWQGWRNRCFMEFETIPWGSVVSVDRAELLLRTTTQVNVAFGSDPKVTLKRITEAWNEGTENNPSYDNATIYPGPSTTNTGSVTRTHNPNEGVDIVWRCDEIVRAWFNGHTQRGIGLFSAGEDSTKYTTEFWDRSNAGTLARPRLRVTMTRLKAATARPAE
jgi:hypothetical protein